ncbi:MAG: efflux RND transporter permease subunit, partial [Ignavibacteriaceae bacterium]|nr:efflux RND transporter permease subunit [Ignavibacteriaceae bacterium]
MSLSQISIQRPVLSIVFSIMIVLFGVIGYLFLGIREYPSVEAPIITVSTNYVGANADVIESQITEPLEESINGIDGIRSLTSVSRDGRSTITVEFNIDVDLEAAANDVRDRVSRAQRNLPPDVDPPIVEKSDADASPIVFLSIRSESRNLMDLTDIARNIFKERLQTIPGVSRVQIWGEKRYSMRLWMDPEKMAAYGITALDVRNALARENIELPSGRIEGKNTELTVRTKGLLQTPDDFANLIIKQDNTALIKLKDIGFSEVYPENDRSILRRDGVPMVGVVLVPQPGSNAIEIADEFYKRVEQIKKDVPADLELKVGFDTTRFIRDSIGEVKETIIIAFGLVILIIFLFLRDWRTTVIPVIAIPISIIGAFFIMYAADFSINVLTLLGIVLSIGLVVDDAIVVLENIYKKIESGMTPIEAAVKGSKEIFFAVISTTITLAAVFLPVIFLQGLTGRLFKEFGIVIAGSVLISSFVALTLTPMMGSRILKQREKHSRFYYLTEPFFVWLSESYSGALNSFMKHRWLGFAAIAASFALIFLIGRGLQSELAPLEDRSGMRLSATAPEGSTFEFMDTYMAALVDEIQKTTPEIDNLVSVTSPGFGAASSVNSGFVRIRLKDPKLRERTQQQIAASLGKQLQPFNDARTFIIQDQSVVGGRGGLPVQFVVQAPNIEKLKEIIPKFMEKARQDPTFLLVDVNMKFNKPELEIEINRLKARELGVSVSDVAQTLQLALSGQRFGFYVLNGKQYQIIGQLERNLRSKPYDISSLYVRNNQGRLIQLDNLVSIKEQSTPPQLYRFNRYVSATFSASLAEGKTVGDGITAMENIASQVLDDTYQTALEGTSKEFVESSSSLIYTFMLALLLIYLILAAQFESFRDPLIIMFTVPLAIAGALISLW